jgi:hypothetical protein
VRVRVIADNLALAAPAVTAAVFTLDNQPPSAAAAVVHIGDDAAFTFAASLSVNWSNSRTKAWAWRAIIQPWPTAPAQPKAPDECVAAIWRIPTVEAVNTVYVWAGDGYGNLGAAAPAPMSCWARAAIYDADELANSARPRTAAAARSDGDRDEMPDGWRCATDYRRPMPPTPAEQRRRPLSNHDEFFWNTDPMDSNSWLVFKAALVRMPGRA